MTIKPKSDDPEQSKRFIETAQRLEVDETDKAFVRAFDAVAVPKKPPKKKRAKRTH